jgi:predicted nicotinamide N-methyase
MASLASAPGAEEEWIESPDGWGKKDGDKEEYPEDDDDDEGALFDLFASVSDPKDCFTFELTLSKVGPEDEDDEVGANPTRKVLLQLSGFQLDSEETAQSTGVTLWQAAPRLATFLMRNSHEYVSGRQVLELGAGLGLCGIVAHHLGARCVILSDGDTQTLQQMRHNVTQNNIGPKSVNDNNNDNRAMMMECRQLIWGSSTQVCAFQESFGLFDTILGADVVYTRQSLDPLLDTVVELLQKKPHSGQFVLSRYTQWNNVSDDVVIEAAAARGLVGCRQPEEGIFVFTFADEGADDER